MVPDCGYKLRRIEFEADGELRTAPVSDGGDSVSEFVISGSGQRIALAGPVEKRGPVRLAGRFESPVGPQPKLIVERVVHR
jgi:hypothetical protein